MAANGTLPEEARRPPARAGDIGGARLGRTSDMSDETSRRGDAERTCATAPTCGWQSLRMRGKERSVCSGIHPSWSHVVSYRKRSACSRSAARYHSTCEQIFSASVLRRTQGERSGDVAAAVTVLDQHIQDAGRHVVDQLRIAEARASHRRIG